MIKEVKMSEAEDSTKTSKTKEHFQLTLCKSSLLGITSRVIFTWSTQPHSRDLSVSEIQLTALMWNILTLTLSTHFKHS